MSAPRVTSTRIGNSDWSVIDEDGNVVSQHQRQDKAFESAANRGFKDGKVYRVVPAEYRVETYGGLPVQPDPEDPDPVDPDPEEPEEPDPEDPEEPDPEPDPEDPDPVDPDPEDPEEPEVGLPADYFVPAKMPMVLVHPRPNSESQPWARYKHAYPGLEYRIPIVVQGGAYPFVYELESGPSGMRVVTGYNDPEYGDLIWVPQSEGVYSVAVKITDQDLNTLTAEFLVTVSKDRFVFVDPNAAAGGVGSLEAPFKRLTEARDSAGRIVYLREGVSYTDESQATSQHGWTIRGDTAPMALLGFPGERAVLDFTNSRITVSGGAENGGDVFVSGLTLQGLPLFSGQHENSARRFHIRGRSGRGFTAYRNVIDETPENIVGSGGNQGSFHVSAKSWESNEYDDYLAFVRNRIIGTHTVSVFGGFYGVRNIVIEGNLFGSKAEPITTQLAVMLKQETTRASVRRNSLFLTAYTDRHMLYLASKRRYTIPEEIEFSYNLIYAPNWPRTNRWNMNPIKLQQSTGDGDVVDDRVWVYRNTIFGQIAAGSGRPIVNTIERNVIVHSGSWVMEPTDTRTVIWNDNLELTDEGDMAQALDDHFRLQGSAQSLAGRVGHEISVPLE